MLGPQHAPLSLEHLTQQLLSFGVSAIIIQVLPYQVHGSQRVRVLWPKHSLPRLHCLFQKRGRLLEEAQ